METITDCRRQLSQNNDKGLNIRIVEIEIGREMVRDLSIRSVNEATCCIKNEESVDGERLWFQPQADRKTKPAKAGSRGEINLLRRLGISRH